MGYWNEKKTKYLLLSTWVIWNSVTIAVLFGYAYTDFHWKFVFFGYVYPIVNFAFVIIALVTYTSLITIAHQSKVAISKCEAGKRKKDHSHNAISPKQFMVPLLIITTFAVFIVIPDFVFLFIVVIPKENPSELHLLISACSYAISNLSDVAIYVFLLRDVRTFFCKIFTSGLGGR